MGTISISETAVTEGGKTAPAMAAHSLASRVRQAAEAWLTQRSARRAAASLERMADRDLRDLGLCRTDLPAIRLDLFRGDISRRPR